MSSWLEKISRDQNLNQLNELETVIWDTMRRMFLSMEIKPGLHVGSIDPDTSRAIPGVQSPLSGIHFSTATVAALTLTVPANRRYRVYYAGALNITQVSDVTLTGTINGNALAVPLVINTAQSQTQFNSVIGINGIDFGGVAIVTVPKEIWLEAGDTLTLTCTTFAALDNTEHLFLYQEFRA